MMMSLLSFFRSSLLTIIFWGFISCLHSQSTVPASKLQADFQILKEALASKNWRGSLTYLNYGDDQTLVELPCSLYTSLKGDKLKTKVVFEEKNKNGKPIVHQNSYHISKDQKYLVAQDKWEIIKTEKQDAGYIITAISKGQDNNRPADFKLTLSFSPSQFIQKKEVRYEGDDTYFMRNEYRFTKP